MSVLFNQVSKIFPDGTVALDQLNLEFDKGEFIILLGPSGSGKTTACRILAGLEEATDGSVSVDDREITNLPPRERNMSIMPNTSRSSWVVEHLLFSTVPRGQHVSRRIHCRQR